MEHLFDQIHGVCDAGFPYAAVVMALTVPDVCANLLLPPEAKAGGQSRRYQNWYRSHIEPVFPFITAADAWSLRCGVVHQGEMGNNKRTFDRVVFAYQDGFSDATLVRPRRLLSNPA